MPSRQKQNQIKKADIKLGNEDMQFWQQIIESRKIDIYNTKKNLRYYEAILQMAEENFKKAEKEFNKK